MCNVIRISADLANSDWSSYLLKNGYSKDIPTFWVLEGLVYYIEREVFYSLVTKMAEISKIGSQIFIDIIHASKKMFFPYSQNENSLGYIQTDEFDWLIKLPKRRKKLIRKLNGWLNSAKKKLFINLCNF